MSSALLFTPAGSVWTECGPPEVCIFSQSLCHSQLHSASARFGQCETPACTVTTPSCEWRPSSGLKNSSYLHNERNLSCTEKNNGITNPVNAVFSVYNAQFLSRNIFLLTRLRVIMITLFFHLNSLNHFVNLYLYFCQGWINLLICWALGQKRAVGAASILHFPPSVHCVCVSCCLQVPIKYCAQSRPRNQPILCWNNQKGPRFSVSQ